MHGELDICVVVCERDLAPGTWQDVLEPLRERPNPSLLIILSRLAGDRLWAQALNLGAWGVAAKPFSLSEVAPLRRAGVESLEFPEPAGCVDALRQQT